MSAAIDPELPRLALHPTEFAASEVPLTTSAAVASTAVKIVRNAAIEATAFFLVMVASCVSGAGMK